MECLIKNIERGQAQLNPMVSLGGTASGGVRRIHAPNSTLAPLIAPLIEAPLIALIRRVSLRVDT